MSAQHTPGPLTVRVSANGDVGIIATSQVYAPDNVCRALVAECFADIRRAGENARDEALANAKLYAAAPRLVAALRQLVDRDFTYADGVVVGSNQPITQQQVSDARDAIDMSTWGAL